MVSSRSILMVSPQFSPLVGGYERAAERLARALGQRGHAVTVVTERRKPEWPSTEDRGLFKIRRLWCMHRERFHVATSLATFFLFMLIRGRRFDLYHIHQYGYHSAVAILIGKLFRRPSVLKLTSTGAEGIESTLSKLGRFRSLLVAIHRKADACVATTMKARDEAVAFGISPDRIAVIPNGIDISEYSPSRTIRDGVTVRADERASGGTAIFCGRLSAAKNPVGMLEAWAAVVATHPTARLVVVGDGPMRPLLEEFLSRRPACTGVTLLGEVSDVVRWYREADVFVLSSNHEGLSNSLLEAMSCGLPVVSTNVSGSSEILALVDVGELVDVGDMAGFALAIGRLLTDPGRRRECGNRARGFIERFYSIEAVCEETQALYGRLLR
jgi:glycosyltransferase involved in cell wall biosynthesis